MEKRAESADEIDRFPSVPPVLRVKHPVSIANGRVL